MSALPDAYLTLERVLNLSSVCGIALLSVPAFSLNFRKRLLGRIETIVQDRQQRGEASALDDIAVELKTDASGTQTNGVPSTRPVCAGAISCCWDRPCCA